METMTATKVWGFLVAFIAIAALVPLASAHHGCGGFACIDEVEVNGVEFFHFDEDPVVGIFAGEVFPVRVTFSTNGVADDGEVEDDVRIVARILGEPGLSQVTERFDVIEGSTYSRTLSIGSPYDLDELRQEAYQLEITIESNSGEADSILIDLEVQRTSYELQILSVDSDEKVRAGESLLIDVAVKNRGRQEAEDTFVMASIDQLGLSKRVFLGDLSSTDEDRRPEKFDSEAARIFLKIPSDTPAGVYDLTVESFNDDSTAVVQRKVVVLGASEESQVIASMTSKTFGTGTAQPYTLTIVNAGDQIKVYELILESANGLAVNFDESIVAVPAGTSRTVSFDVVAQEAGTHNFAVNVHSDGELVKKQSYVATVSGRGSTFGTSGSDNGGDSAVLLTVVLAIIFVVLLVVLIVLLTRRPERNEEFGESYY